jgi:hypothetical protein
MYKSTYVHTTCGALARSDGAAIAGMGAGHGGPPPRQDARPRLARRGPPVWFVSAALARRWHWPGEVLPFCFAAPRRSVAFPARRATDTAVAPGKSPASAPASALARHWPGTGTGPALARRWPGTGTGPALARHWPGTGTGTGTGPALARHWHWPGTGTGTGPALARHRHRHWPAIGAGPAPAPAPGRRSAARAQATTCGSCGTRSSASGVAHSPAQSIEIAQCRRTQSVEIAQCRRTQSVQIAQCRRTQSVEIAQCRRTARPRPSTDVHVQPRSDPRVATSVGFLSCFRLLNFI